MATVYTATESSPGYHLWRVEITRSDGSSFNADSVLVGEISYGFPGTRGMATQFDIPLTQGTSQAVREVLVPNWSNTPYWSASFSLNGVDLKGLDSNFNTVSAFRSMGRSTLIVTQPGEEQDRLSTSPGS